MILLDFETTGLTGTDALPVEKQPRIIEATFSKVDDKTLKEIDNRTMMINPLTPISDEVTKITTITWAMLKNQQPFPYHYDTICQFFLGQSTMVAHNCEFEGRMLANELLLIGKVCHFPWPPRRICTVEASQHILKRRLRLGELYKMATGKELKGAHRTKVDVEALRVCLLWLKKKGHISL